MDTKAEIISLGFSGESRTIFAEDIGRLMSIPAGRDGTAAIEIPGNHTQSTTAPVDPLNGDTWYKPDTEQMFWRFNATWCAIPFTADPDGVFIVNLQLADVTEITPEYGVLGRNGLDPTIGDGITPGGRPIVGASGGSQLTMTTDATDAVKAYNLTAIPDSWKENVTTIKALSIGSTVTSIGVWAFRGCTGLTGRLIIPDSVTYMGTYAFNNCSGLTGALVLPPSYLTPEAYDNGAGSVTNDGFTNSAFEGCTGLTSLSILGAWPSIPFNMFYGCAGFTGTLPIPPTVTNICDNAYYGCAGFTGPLPLPNGLLRIGKQAFRGCTGITGELIIPPTVIKLCQSAFYGLSISSATIPASVVSIANGLFYNCAALTTINAYIPMTLITTSTGNLTGSGVTTIHARASDSTWTAGAGQTISGKSGITVIKDL